MDVADWLRRIGFGQYEAAFRDNGIGEAVLPHLTVEDLKEIGVATVGDRRMLLAAIAALASPTALEPIGAQPSPPPPKKDSEVSAERRPITVMFCDLVGSTSLAAKLDAEDWRNLVNAYLDEASTAVTDFGGHVLKKLGDGLMALFGYPKAQENDAERAVRAALAIQRALAELNARNAGQGRAGARRPHRARFRVGRGRRRRRGVRRRAQCRGARAGRGRAGVGPCHAPCSGRSPGCSSRRSKGAHELKGVPEPVTLYRIVRASGGGRRGGARALTSFVGREEDIGTLLASLGARPRRRGPVRPDRRRARARQVAPDRGVSYATRRDAAHLDRVDRPRSYCRTRRCIRSRNGAGCGLARTLPAEQRLADLENTLRLVDLDGGEYAPLIAPLVDIPLPEGPRREVRAGGIAAAATRGDDGLVSGGRADAAGRPRLRGSALGRSDVARPHPGAGRTRRASAVTRRRHHTPRISRALGDAFAPCGRCACATRPD